MVKLKMAPTNVKICGIHETHSECLGKCNVRIQSRINQTPILMFPVKLTFTLAAIFSGMCFVWDKSNEVIEVLIFTNLDLAG